jgi:hypothetical protein
VNAYIILREREVAGCDKRGWGGLICRQVGSMCKKEIKKKILERGAYQVETNLPLQTMQNR